MGAFGVTDDEFTTWLGRDGVRVVLAEAVAYSGGATETRYLASFPFCTRPIDTPANQIYTDLILEIPAFEAKLTEAFSGRSLPSFGDLVLYNPNGILDDWLADGWDGRALTLKIGAPQWHIPDFRPLLTGVVADIDAPSRDTIALKLRDKGHLFDIPVQTNLIGGTTANADQPAPLCFGECFNVEPVLTDAATHTYQVHDGTINAISEVRDNGVSVAFTANLAAGTFTLSSAPAGRITADVQGAAPSGRYLTQCHEIVEWLALNKAGLASSELDPVSFPTLNIDLTRATTPTEMAALLTAAGVTFTRADATTCATWEDADGVLQTVAANLPRPRYVSGVHRGLMVEESKKNEVRNNMMIGAVAGTPGTLPTNWVVGGNASALSRQVVGTGVEDGITYVDLRFYGTVVATALPELTINFSVWNEAAATIGQTRVASVFVRVVGGSLTNITSGEVYQIYANTGGTLTEFLQHIFSYETLSSRLKDNRIVTAAYTTVQATTAWAYSRIDINFPAGGNVPVDVTLRIGLPQQELGGTATSPIANSGTANTRAADVPVMTGSNFSRWYNQVEGAFLVRATLTATTTDTTSRILYAAGDSTIAGGSADVHYAARGASSAAVYGVTVDGGATQRGTTAGSIAVNTPFTLVDTYKVNDFGSSLSGAAVVADTAGNLPTPTGLSIGGGSQAWASAGSIYNINGGIERITYWPSRLPNADTQTLSAGYRWAPATPLGLYIKERRNLIDVIDDLVTSIGAFWTFTRSGLLRLGRLEAPAGTADLTLIADDIEAESIGLAGRDLPAASVRLGYAKNWTPQDPDGLAGAVSEADRTLYAAPHSVAKATNSVSTQHLLAPNPDVVETLIVTAADALTEAERRAALRSVVRTTVRLTTFAQAHEINLGDVADLTHPRFGFSAGELAVVTALRERALDGRVELELWK